VRAAILASVAVLFSIVSCGGGAAYRYRELAERYGLHRGLHHSFLLDGQSVEMQVSDPRGRPIQGLTMIIAAEGEALTLVSDANGRLAFPVSSTLLNANPEVEIERPPGAERFYMALNVSLKHACDGGTRPGLPPLVRDFERLPVRDFGPDRVYAERGVAAEAVQRTGERLAHARALFVELTGAPPPAIGVMLTKIEAPSMGSQDRAGRVVWPVSEPSVANGSGLLTLVHEWTHAVMHELLTGERNDRARYVEDGLCEVMSHLAYERAHGTRGSPRAADRAAELVAFAKHPSFDLLSLGEQFSMAKGLSVFDQFASICSDARVTIGYGLGFAFWLEQLDRDPDVLQRLFADLRKVKRPGDQAFIAAADALSQPRGAMRNVDVARAITTLRSHGPQALAP
jgi:hypothetical protein